MKIDSQFGREKVRLRAGQGCLPYQGPDPPATTKLLFTREEPPHRHTHRAPDRELILRHALTPECSHMGILEHFFLAESLSMLASCDN